MVWAGGSMRMWRSPRTVCSCFWVLSRSTFCIAGPARSEVPKAMMTIATSSSSEMSPAW